MVWTPTEGEGGTPLPPVTTEQQNIVASNSIITCDSMGRGFIQHVIGKGGVYSIFLSRGGFCKKHAMCGGGGVTFNLLNVTNKTVWDIFNNFFTQQFHKNLIEVHL